MHYVVKFLPRTAMDNHGEAVKFCPHILLKSVLISPANQNSGAFKMFPLFS